MKKQILSIVATLGLLIPMAIIGFAGLNGRVRVNIPFEFMVGGKQLPAGTYTIDRFSNTGTTIIRGTESDEMANFNTNNVTDKGNLQARLVFRRYGNQHFLAQVFDGQTNLGIELLKSKAEREAAKKRDTITQNFIEPLVETVVAQAGK